MYHGTALHGPAARGPTGHTILFTSVTPQQDSGRGSARCVLCVVMVGLYADCVAGLSNVSSSCVCIVACSKHFNAESHFFHRFFTQLLLEGMGTWFYLFH